MSCPANTVLASAAANGFFSLDPGTLQLAIAQLTCDLKASATSSTFVSSPQAFGAPTLYTFAHGLGAQPKFVRAVLLSTGTNLGFVENQEVDVFSVFHTASATAMWTVYADATNVYVALREAMPSGAADAKMSPAAGGVSQVLDWSQWKLKVYAKL